MSNNKKDLLRLGVTIGDPNGISPEIILKSFKDVRMLELCTPVIYASKNILSFYKKELDISEFNFSSIPSADKLIPGKVNLINIIDDFSIQMGVPTKESGGLSIKSLEMVAQDLADGKLDVMVTAPFSKEAVQKSGFDFPGHTEFLAKMAGLDEALMVLVSPTLRVALVTSHIPIKNVPETLSKELIYDKIVTFNKSLIQDFGVVKPKVAVLGLNPHAGENGKIGEEELEIIIPAIEKAKSDGILAFGPYPSDGFFGSSAVSKFDGVLAMFHDQGLGPFKALAFDDGVNYTAGLPIARTSPDHGTAFDISGKNIASAQSMRSAIYSAIDIYKKRKEYKNLTQNTLKNTQLKGNNKKSIV